MFEDKILPGGRGISEVIAALAVGDAFMDVGGECADTRDCVPPPEGVKRLMALLQELTADQLECGPCFDVFPKTM